MTSIQIYSNSDEVAQLFVLLFNIVPIRVHQKKIPDQICLCHVQTVSAEEMFVCEI